MFGLFAILIREAYIDVTRVSEPAKFLRLHPKKIDDVFILNKFGVIFMTILFNITLPVVAIFYWLVILCTFEPKKKNNKKEREGN